jgi:hypothetical protein
MRVLEELLDGSGENQAPPHDRLLLIGQEAHGEHAQEARSDATLERDHLALSGFDVTVHAQEARDREAPNISIEYADGEPAGGQGHGEVHGDRGFPDSTFA